MNNLYINYKKTKLMGILNINEDSFYDKSRFSPNNVINDIENMIKDGASIIDIGAISSKPGSKTIAPQEELKRVKKVFDLIYKNKLYENITFSIDSYTPVVIKYALDSGFKIVNDITGLKSDEVTSIIASYNAKVVIMHMQNSPYNMQKNPKYNNIILDIENFFIQRIDKAIKFGIKDIILDVGIGFGKNLEHNLTLLKNLQYYHKFNYKLLIGASRKSMINDIVKSDIKDRLPGSLAIHLYSINKGVSIIRCHDIKEHYQAIKIKEAILKMDEIC
jgi:dihydropteroate synthase